MEDLPLSSLLPQPNGPVPARSRSPRQVAQPLKEQVWQVLNLRRRILEAALWKHGGQNWRRRLRP